MEIIETIVIKIDYIHFDPLNGTINILHIYHLLDTIDII